MRKVSEPRGRFPSRDCGHMNTRLPWEAAATRTQGHALIQETGLQPEGPVWCCGNCPVPLRSESGAEHSCNEDLLGARLLTGSHTDVAHVHE